MCKRFDGIMKYGRGTYDFNEGSLMFTAPQQIIAVSPDINAVEGWGLFFHPHLLSGSGLQMREYSFFNYDVNEALHISDDENQTLLDCLEKIKKEYSQNTDRHTQGLIVDNLRLLLNYCNRFYDRQFLTRAKVNKDIVQQFEQLLHDYFASELIEAGLPGVKYFASKLNLSSHYLSDLLNKHTGKTTQEFIHLAFAEKAKHLLWSTQKPISEIAYELGFEHPSHFTKLFKSQTGQSPREFRKIG
jgi:AraC-like DNA-binding protein